MVRHSIKFLAALAAGMMILSAAIFVKITRADDQQPDTQPAAPPAQAGAGARDPALWPFSVESPWNAPLGAAAHYDKIISDKFDTSGTFVVNCTHWSHPIFIATETDPVKEIHEDSEVKPAAQTNIPAAAAPDPEEDAHLHIINPAHTRVVEMYHAKINADGTITAEGVVENDLRGLGIFKKPHGMRAYGGSSIGGVIRRGELKTGIRHVLAAATLRGVLSKTSPGGTGFVWPANHADDDWKSPADQGGYGDKGNIYMGSLLAIPPDVDIKSLVGPTGPAFEVARALQDYGCYIVDTSGDNLDITIEPAAAGEVPGDLEQQLAKLLPKLKVVSNNTADTPGGGGKPRRLLAPELIEAPAGYRPGSR